MSCGYDFTLRASWPHPVGVIGIVKRPAWIGGSVQAAELPHWQRFLPGTTAWRTPCGRRQVVEGANGMLKGGFANIAHKFFRVFGRTKMRILLASAIVGYKLEAISSFLSKKTAERTAAPPKRTRKKSRKGTWTPWPRGCRRTRPLWNLNRKIEELRV